MQTNSISIASPVNATGGPVDGKIRSLHPSMDMTPQVEDTIDIEAQEMDYDTIELKESNIGASNMVGRNDLTFRLKADR